MTDLPPKKAIPYDDLLALVYRLEQRVNDLTAQLAQHAASRDAHEYYRLDGIGLVVLDGEPVVYDYDPTGEMDTPELTAEQRARIWAAVWGGANGGSDAKR